MTYWIIWDTDARQYDTKEEAEKVLARIPASRKARVVTDKEFGDITGLGA